MRIYRILLFSVACFFSFPLLFSMEEGNEHLINLEAKIQSYVGEASAYITQPYGKLDLKVKDPISQDTFADMLLQKAKEEKIPLHVVLVTTMNDSEQYARPFEFYSYFQSQLGNNFLSILYGDKLFFQHFALVDPTNNLKAVSLVLFQISPETQQATFLGYLPNEIDNKTSVNTKIIDSIKKCAWKEYTKKSISQVKDFLQQLNKTQFDLYLTTPSLFTKEVWERIMREFQYAFSKDVLSACSAHEIKMLAKIAKYTIYFALISPYISSEDLTILFNTWNTNKQLMYKEWYTDDNQKHVYEEHSVWDVFLKYFSFLASIHKNEEYAMACLDAYDPEKIMDKALLRARVMHGLRKFEEAKKILKEFDQQHKDYAYAQCIYEYIKIQNPDDESVSLKERISSFFHKFNITEFYNKIMSSDIFEEDKKEEALILMFVLCADITAKIKFIQQEFTSDVDAKSLQDNVLQQWEKLQNIMNKAHVSVNEQFYVIARIAHIMESITSY